MAIAAHTPSGPKSVHLPSGRIPYLLKGLENAISQAREKGYLKDLNLTIQEGAGAYICGEESALMNSIEGKRGESRFRPPFPTQAGLFKKPTIINNVETLSNVPHHHFKGCQMVQQTGDR
jgi:NADH:ubiquinone oxidoreductase subunit F (NADH-binding)